MLQGEGLRLKERYASGGAGGRYASGGGAVAVAKVAWGVCIGCCSRSSGGGAWELLLKVQSLFGVCSISNYCSLG